MNFHSINWLYAGFAALALLAIVGVWADRRRKRELARFASARLLPGLAQTVSPNKILLKKILFALGVLAVFAALARPQWGYRWEETKSRGIDIIFAVDTSKSMLAEDVKPSRLERAKLSVLDLAEMLDGNRIGIVAFSGQAFLQCPLTLDYDAFRMSLEALDTNVIQRGGTNIAAAITEAETAFAETSNKKVIVLISDGEELESSALAKAKQAAKNGVVIYALGVGGKKGEAIYVRDENGHSIKLRDESGNVVTSKLNEEVLTQIAKATGGFYEPLSASGIETIYEDGLKKIPQRELSARMKQLAIERFQIPLAIAAVLLALEYLVGTRKFFARRRRSGALNIALIGIISAAAVAPEKSEAAEPPAQEPPAQAQKQEAPKPEEKQEGKNPEKKDPTPIDIFNAAIDLSQKGETAKAREMYIEAVKADPSDFKLHAKAYYNIANAEYKSAKNSLAEAESAKEAAQRLARQEQAESAAMASGLQLLEQGKPLLEEEQKALASAKTEDEKKAAAENSPLKKDKKFQESLKRGIAMCEAAEKNFEELKKSRAENLLKWKNALGILGGAKKNYRNAAALDPEFVEPKKNLDSASAAEKNLQKEIGANEKISKALDSDAAKQKLQNIAKMKEELKKLVRDDNNQNNQNQQNQQNQQNNQNNQNNQQNDKQNNQDNKQNQDKQDKQNQQNQNQQDSDKDKNSQDKQDQQKQDRQQQQKQNEQKQDRQDKEQNGQNADQKNADKKPEEQAVENKPEKKDASQKQSEQPEEKPVEKKEASSAAAAKEGEEKPEQRAAAAIEGAMTKGEAKQLLESMKDADKILPLRGFGEQKDRFEKSYKDW